MSIVEGKGRNATLSGVQLVDGRTVDIGINVNANDLIVIDVKNREMNGKSGLRLPFADRI